MQTSTTTTAEKDVKGGTKKLLFLTRFSLTFFLSGCVSQKHSHDQWRTLFFLPLFFFDLEENFFRCASAQIYTQKIFLFPSSLSPALCHHDFFSNHLLQRKSESSPLNSIRTAKLQLSINIQPNRLPLKCCGW